MLQVNQVSKRYPNGTQALSEVNIHVNKGENIILLGHNGSGKSTLLRSIGGLEKPTSGDILLEGRSVCKAKASELRQLQKSMGNVFQKFNLIPTLSVFQNVLFGALGRHPFVLTAFHPFAKKELREKAMYCLERVGLRHLAERRADQLSGGQQQRVAIARMLLQEPAVVLADEPIASLDPKAGIEVMDLLIEVAKEHGLTFICTLHQLDLALDYGSRFIGLNKGVVVLDETKANQTAQSFDRLYDERIEEAAYV